MGFPLFTLEGLLLSLPGCVFFGIRDVWVFTTWAPATFVSRRCFGLGRGKAIDDWDIKPVPGTGVFGKVL